MAEVPEYIVDTFMLRMSSFGMSLAFFKTVSPLADIGAPGETIKEKENIGVTEFIEQVEGKKTPDEPQCVSRMSLSAAKAMAIIVRKVLQDFEKAQGGSILVPKDFLAKNGVTLTEW